VEIRFADVLRRLLLGARGLGLVFLVYFIPVVLRDVAGALLPGAAWLDLFSDDAGQPWGAVAVVAATFALSAGATLLHARRTPEGARPLAALRGDAAWRREWGIGLLLGAGLATVAVAPALLTGALRVEGLRAPERPDLLVALLVVLVLEAAREELGFRGAPLRDLSGAVGFPVAALFLAASFMIIHAGNPAVDRRGLLAILFAGLALAGLVRARGDVAMASGLHAAWNVSLALVWSVPVSGIQTSSSLLDVRSDGSSLWTGGSFGVEGSVPAVVVLGLLGFATWRLPARSGPSDTEGSEERA
jgi:membrane protease YdiL (CAAX protease family)